jgi:hypothetical protein
MPEEAVKRMGAKYAAVKDETLNALKARTLFFRSSSGQDNVDESVDESRLQIFGIKF